MAESLTAEQIAERRTNLRAFRASLGMTDDSEFTTTLLIQEEWLATVDELQGFVRDAQIIRGLRLHRCFVARWLVDRAESACKDFAALKVEDYCAPCYLRAIHEGAE